MVFLGKENNRPTEQTFHVRINLGPFTGTINSATEGEDYATDLIDNTIIVHFPPNMVCVKINITIFPDDIAEGNEGIVLTSSPAGDI